MSAIKDPEQPSLCSTRPKPNEDESMQLLRDAPICAPLSYNFIRSLLEEVHHGDQSDTIDTLRNCLDVVHEGNEKWKVVYVSEDANGIVVADVDGSFGSADQAITKHVIQVRTDDDSTMPDIL